jgi:TolB-like protein/tetratricopeptide (TPR) repeat protein
MTDAAVVRFLRELRRRRVFRVAGMYIVGLWLLMQAADILFPGWGIPDAAIRYLFWAGLLGFPVALVFGWVFDISTQGIRRTQPVGSDDELLRSMPLRRLDYLVLAAFVAVLGAIAYDTTGRVLETATTVAGGPGEWRPATAEIEPHSVAVLPFANLSADPDQDYFADGISEEILNRLSAFRELKVIARTSSFVFKDSGYDIARISSLLGVNYLLQGSVRRDGPRLRISAQLLDRSGVQVWSSTLDRELGAVFSLQDEIAEAVATSIVPQIVPPPALKREPDLEAYQQYLIGREMLHRRAAMFWRDGAEHFTRAIELDPEYAAPYAARAITRVFSSRWVDDRALELERAMLDAEQAVALDPDFALGHAARGLLLAEIHHGSLAEQEAALRRALELDPTLVDAWNWLSIVLAAQGRHDEAGEANYRGVRLDPLSPPINTNAAMREAWQGRIEEAERRLLRLLEVPNPSPTPYLALCRLQRNTGRIAEALECGKRRVLAFSPREGRAFATHVLTRPYAMLGMHEEAEYWLARGVQEWPEVFGGQLWRAELLGLATGAMSYADAIADFEAGLESASIALEQLGTGQLAAYGTLLALAGDFDAAIPLLEAIGAAADHPGNTEWRILARHALAWAYLNSGAGSNAAQILHALDAHFREREAAGYLHLSDGVFDYARNELLLVRHERALELLERAAEAGWRGYYQVSQDPRWDAVRDDPRFGAIMSRVKADLEVQRARVEEIEAAEDFVARLDAAIAAHAGRAEAR